MPPSPAKLKEKLLKAIDEEHNITNYDLLLEVIEQLEKTALTREDLETTRIGRYINDVRKKAPNELGKRLRKLVKAWQALANSTPSNNASPASGYSPALGYANSPGLPSRTHTVASPLLSGRSSKSPALQSNKARLVSPALNNSRGQLSSPSVAELKGKLASPCLGERAGMHASALHDKKAKLVSSALNDSIPHRLVSPLVRQAGGHDSPVHVNSKRISPSNFKPITPRNIATTPFIKSSHSRSATPNGKNHLRDNVGTRTPTPPHLNNHVHVTPNIDSTHRTHAANKKRRRSDESCTSDGSSIKKTRHTINGESSSRIGERIRTPKVKTTVEIIAELQAGKSVPLTDSDTITKIVTNQIKKEEDDIHRSVVPSSAMPKSRRKHGTSSLPGPPSARTDLSKTKSDLVHRFLHQQQQQRHSTDNDELPYDGVDYLSSAARSAQPEAASAPPATNMTIDPYSLLPPIDYDRIKWEDDEPEDVPIVRNAITGEYPEGYNADHIESSNHYDAPHVERVINENWHGVNGTASENSQFHPWTETFTICTSEDSPENASVILPYVDI
ncbi:mediator of RNA polymerase II transcription subunit 26-like [Watersipora subatra]|uniref:mediator of RNA polymerase II transcription subunit 26-like n=1 Tax=Watersipora subatra TaxID=2589382 RepID=UPI00355C44D9